MSVRKIPAPVFLAAILLAIPARADVKPAPLFSDHAVLQQAMSIPIWGSADAGESVTVTLAGQTQSVTAGADGKWMIKLEKLTAGGPFDMTIAGKNSITLHDVLIGEVWIASGQSNMEFTVSKKGHAPYGLINEDQEIAAADYPQIRMFTGKQSKSYDPQPTVNGQWLICNPQNVPNFSAVGYLFARDLQKELNVPIGIVTLAYGASTAEAWISRDVMSADPLLKPMLDGFDASEQFYKTNPTVLSDKAPVTPTPINKPRTTRPSRQRDPVQDQHEPTVLFNGMISPAIPYAMRGVIWYQGESIVGGSAGVAKYGHVQNTLIQDWRNRWGEGDFPFYIVELPGQKNVSNNPLIREQQATVYDLKNTGMAVIMDTGEATNVHPHDKEPLGDRLTRIALANTYGKSIEYSGPVFDSMTVEGHSIRLKFTHIGGGLVAKDGPLKWFQIAGDDQKFEDADAKIDGDTIAVSGANVNSPVAVRYAWDNFPDGCNLFNAAGLQASPFRTDRWPYKIDVVEN